MRTIFVAIVAGLLLIASATGTADPASGTIHGKVTFTGTAPDRKAIDMSKDPACTKMYSSPPTGESIVAGANDALENVVVFISAGAPDDAAPSMPVKIAQRGCRYVPHVVAFHADQELWVANDDPTVHNVFAQAKKNPPSNKSQLKGAPEIVEKFSQPEFIPVKCNVHPWMHGTFAVMRNSHFAVTGESGTFALPNLPPGKYIVTAWQETLGEQSQQVTITGAETKTIDFKFAAH
jgi:Carboxypeptidase regulatory-like domain